MASTFPKALRADSGLATVSGGNTGLDNTIQTTIQLIRVADGASARYTLRKGDGGAAAGWGIKVFDVDDEPRIFSYTRRVGGGMTANTYGSGVGVGEWFWLVNQFNRAAGTQLCFAGPYGGSLTARNANVDEDSGAAAAGDDTAFPLQWGDRDGAGEAPTGTAFAVLAVDDGLPNIGTLQSYVDDMEATIKASALLYWRVLSDTVDPLPDGSGNLRAGEFSGFTIVDGPDVAGGPSAAARRAYRRTHLLMVE